MRLLLDEQHDPEVARQLRARGHDVSAVAAPEFGRGLSDPEVLDLATAERRALRLAAGGTPAVEARAVPGRHGGDSIATSSNPVLG